jgi:hypothetical protein
MQLHTLLGMEAVDMHMHRICTLRFTCIEVVDMRSFFSFEEVVYLFYIMMLFTSLCCSHGINSLTMNYSFHKLSYL